MSFSDKRPDPWAAVFAVASLLFPLAAALSMRWTGPWPIIAVLIALSLLRTVLPTKVPVPVEMTLCLLAVAVIELLVALIDAELAARLYPVFMNLTMLLNRDGSPRSARAEARVWLERLALAGHSSAAVTLGAFYFHGEEETEAVAFLKT